jgi:hypothetical protein
MLWVWAFFPVHTAPNFTPIQNDVKDENMGFHICNKVRKTLTRILRIGELRKLLLSFAKICSIRAFRIKPFVWVRNLLMGFATAIHSNLILDT